MSAHHWSLSEQGLSNPTLHESRIGRQKRCRRLSCQTVWTVFSKSSTLFLMRSRQLSQVKQEGDGNGQ